MTTSIFFLTAAFGAIGFMAIVNFAQFITNKDSVYLWYALYLVSFNITVYNRLLAGVNFTHTNQDALLHRLPIILYFIFSYDFLQFSISRPQYKTKLVITFSIYVLLTLIELVLFCLNEVVLLEQARSLFGMIRVLSILVCIYYISLLKSPLRIFFIIGTLFLALGYYKSPIFLNQVFHVNLYDEDTSSFEIICILIEILCFTLALAYRSHLLLKLKQHQIEQEQHEKEQIRNNIAADLHDDVGAALTNIEILSFLSKNQMSDPFKTGNLIDKISEEAKKTNESLHQLVWAMKTENDGLEPTLAQLNRLAVDNLEIQGIDFSVRMPQQDLSNYRLVGERRRDLIMVFKEVITNITKHAKATAVLVTIELKDKGLSIKIQDNGVGMDKEKLGGNGLNNMAQRMARIGGHFEISSPDTEGVTAVLTLPL